MDQITELIQGSIDRVSQFYADEGFPLEEPATFVVINEYHKSPLYPLLMQAPGELEGLQAVHRRFIRETGIEALMQWYANRGVNLSRKALEEASDVDVKRFRAFNGVSDADIDKAQSHGRDIIVYKRFADELDRLKTTASKQAFSDTTMAHELWHLVEMEQGMLDDLIIEGTAEFARLYFETKKYGAPLGEWEAPDVPAYQQATEVVQANASTLADLLNSQLRKKIEEDYIEYMKELMSHMSQPDVEVDPEQLNDISRQLYPEFDILDTEFSKNAVTTAMRAMGKHKLADELAQQDCSKLLDWYKFLGYGVKACINE